MACRLPAPSHYLNQWWNIVNWTLGNKLQWNLILYLYKKMHLKMSSGNWQPFCLGLNVLNVSTPNNPPPQHFHQLHTRTAPSYFRHTGKHQVAVTAHGSSVDPSHVSHYASHKYPTMHYLATESVTKWCIMDYGTRALWDLCNRSTRVYCKVAITVLVPYHFSQASNS